MRQRECSLLSLLIPLLLCAGATAGEVEVRAGGIYRLPITSLQEARFQTVVRQKYDFSCGSAALATLLTYHYGLETPEQTAFDAMWKVGDQKIIDGLGPDGVAASSRLFSGLLRRVQTGFVYHYSFLMLIAAVAFGAYAIFAGIGGVR